MPTTLASLALLKTRYDVEQSDFLDTLRPFVCYVLTKNSMVTFEAVEAQSHLLQEFGLAIPRHTVDLLLRRMSREKLLSREKHQYIVINAKCDIPEFDRLRADSVRHVNATLAGLIEYAKDALQKELSQDDAETALNKYIDQYAVECIKSYSHGSIVPKHGKSPEHWHYMVSSYVNYISDKDPQRFGYLVTVVMGRMLSNALLAEDLGAIKMKFHETCVYLDTPVVLQVLGALGDAPQLLAEEMLVLLGKAQAQVAVFEHDIHEVDQILRYVQGHLQTRRSGKGSVLSAMRDKGLSPTDAALLRSSVQQRLADRGIHIIPTPPYVNNFQIDEIALEGEMEDAELFYRYDGAKRIDVNSIRSIYVLRLGQSPTHIETCKAVLVTNNSALARAAFAYGRNHEESRAISTVITDFSLTNFLWLKAPMEYVDVPRRMIAVNCYAALQPRAEFWALFLSQLDALEKRGKVTPTQHQFLRYELRARRDLMNLTLGDQAQLNDNQIMQVLDRHEQELTRPLKEQVDSLRTAVLTAEQERDRMTALLNKLEARVQRAGAIVRVIISGFLLIAGAILLSLAHGLFGKGVIESFPNPWNIVAIGSVYLADAFIILHAIFHISLWNPVSWIAKRVEAWLVERIRKMLGLQ